MGKKRHLLSVLNKRVFRRLEIPPVIPRVAGLVMPLVLVGYSLLTMEFWLPTWENVAFITVSCLWLILGIWQFSPSAPIRPWFKVIANNIFAAFFAVYIGSFWTALVVAWVVLGIESALIVSPTAGAVTAVFAVVASIIRAFRDGGGIDYLDIAGLIATVVSIVFAAIFVLRMLTEYSKSEDRLLEAMAAATRQKERLDTTINAITEVIIATDSRGKVLLYNAAALNLLDTNENLKRYYVYDLLRLSTERRGRVDLKRFIETLEHITTRDNWYYNAGPKDRIRLEVTISPIKTAFSGAGEAREMAEKANPGRRKAFSGYVFVINDVTKRKELEEEKDIFIGKTSHELRKPVAMLEGSLSNLALMEQRGMLTRAKLQDALDATHRQAQYLAGLVNQLTAVSEAEQALDTKLESIAPAGVVSDLALRYGDEVIAKKLKLATEITEDLPQVRTSRVHLEEVLQNFIGNAIKYTPSGTITIGVRAGEPLRETGEPTVKFFIRDTGVGLSKADQTRIFEKFYRVEDYLTESTSGMGLGLYLVAKLAKLLGGDVDVESELGRNHGSTFSISLPVEEPLDKA